MASLSSIPAAVNRLRTLEAQVAALQRRVDQLEADSAAVDAVRADVAALTITLTERLNEIAGSLIETSPAETS